MGLGLYCFFCEFATSRKNASSMLAHYQLLNCAVFCYTPYLKLHSFCFVFPESSHCFFFSSIESGNAHFNYHVTEYLLLRNLRAWCVFHCGFFGDVL